MEKISWNDQGKKRSFTVMEKSNIVNRTKRRKANWNEHILHRNDLPKHVIATKVERKRKGRRRRERRHKQLLDDK